MLLQDAKKRKKIKTTSASSQYLDLRFICPARAIYISTSLVLLASHAQNSYKACTTNKGLPCVWRSSSVQFSVSSRSIQL
jgi:hypothetical protein